MTRKGAINDTKSVGNEKSEQLPLLSFELRVSFIDYENFTFSSYDLAVFVSFL